MDLFDVLALIGLVFLALMLGLALFEPMLPYRISRRLTAPVDTGEFLRIVGTLAGARVHTGCSVEVLTNAEVYYEAELAAIREARHHVNLEFYIFQKGAIARRFVDALAERARAGVQVNLIVDAVGSFGTPRSYFKALTEAGAQVAFYHPIRFHTLPRINNRTHREIIIVDGEVAFVGGAGVADHWWLDHGRHRAKRRWRDTMFRVEGEAVRDLQSTFVENWVECSGELLAAREYFPCCEVRGESAVMVVGSSPTSGRSTRARMLYQTLLAAAKESIYITTPYFLPDKSLRAELVRAMTERGVEVKVITPGRHADHLLTRRSSRRLYGQLLEAGASIYEYRPSMIHTKSLIIDGQWGVVGSTNFDHRSFGINDEVNIAVFDPTFAARLQEDFARDLSQSLPVTYRDWKRRSLFERGHEVLGWLLERQQ
jgi:cardiolipin synthase